MVESGTQFMKHPVYTSKVSLDKQIKTSLVDEHTFPLTKSVYGHESISKHIYSQNREQGRLPN